MLVPLKLRKPPPTLADRMSTPGAATWAIVLEKSAISSLPPAPWPSAATVAQCGHVPWGAIMAPPDSASNW